MNNKFQNFKTKLQKNRKFQIQFVSIVAACVVVLACAITIPVAVHNNNIKKAMTEEVENSTSDIAVTEEISEPETTTNEATTLADETLTTAAPTSAIADVENKTTEKNNKNSNGGGSSNNGGSGGSSNNKPTTTKPVTTTKKETPTEDDKWNWTQADVDAAVAEAKKYAISKGCKIYSDAHQTVTINGQVFNTSWSNPVDTRVDAKTRGVGNLKYQVDCAIKYGCNLPFLYGEDGNGVNIFSEKHDGYWEIYVVY